MLEVAIKGFSYQEKEVLKNIKFSLQKGEHLSILGESGCGKSTLLHLIYGLLQLEKGEIKWNGNILKGPKYNLIPGEPFIKLVAQDFNLMPYTSVSENIATYLPRQNLKNEGKKVKQLLKLLALEKFAHTKINALSGGQKQRVALGKALAVQPELLLLDEPYSNLDYFKKEGLQKVIFKYLKEENISCITATHDAQEALSFSDSIFILKEGKVICNGTPEGVYNSVNKPYEAGFFGSFTFFPDNLKIGSRRIFFPHQIKKASKKTPLKCSIVSVYFKGSHYLIEGLINKKIPVYFNHSKSLPIKQEVYLTLMNT